MTDTAAERARETREKAMRLARKHQPLPYIKGSRTSKAAAEDMETEAPTKRVQVMAFLLHRGESGATDHQMQEALDMIGDTQRPRRRWWQKHGYIVDSGRKRETPSGREATVWVAKMYDEDQIGLDV